MDLCWQAKAELDGKGVKVRVVSMPSWELFDRMSEAYKNNVLPPDGTKRLAVEAGATMGWERFVGSDGAVIGIDRFGASGPGDQVMANCGMRVENVVEKALELLK